MVQQILDESNEGFQFKYIVRNVNPNGLIYYGLSLFETVDINDVLNQNLLCPGSEPQTDGSSNAILVNCQLNGGLTYYLQIVTDIDGNRKAAQFSMDARSENLVIIPGIYLTFFSL